MIVRVHEEFAVLGKDDFAPVRMRIKTLAHDIGMSRMKEVEVRTAATELLTNMVRYAGGGTAVVEQVEHEAKHGLRAEFKDKGPGIANIEAALTKGYSTGKSLGHGLSGCRNLVDTFDLHSRPGDGTRVVITKWC